jgi:hypothetical protein
MFKCSLLFFSLLLCGVSYAQIKTNIHWQLVDNKSSGDTIYYNPGEKLTWNDFKGVPKKDSIAVAVTESGFGYRLSMQSTNRKAEINITVFCYFSKLNSWVKPDLKSDYALLHEQHHFDITYINACLFIEKLRAANFTLENFAYLTEKINDECFSALEKMQNEYDGQTRNGRVKNIQFAWNKKIDQQLDSLITNSQ